MNRTLAGLTLISPYSEGSYKKTMWYFMPEISGVWAYIPSYAPIRPRNHDILPNNTNIGRNSITRIILNPVKISMLLARDFTVESSVRVFLHNARNMMLRNYFISFIWSEWSE